MSNNAIDFLFALMNFIWAKMKIHFLPMNVKRAIVCPLMLLNVNTHANVVLEGFFRANEVYFGVNEKCIHLNETTIDKNEWIFSVNEQQKES